MCVIVLVVMSVHRYKHILESVNSSNNNNSNNKNINSENNSHRVTRLEHRARSRVDSAVLS